jgi:hypothetical protein
MTYNIFLTEPLARRSQFSELTDFVNYENSVNYVKKYVKKKLCRKKVDK